MNNLVDATQPYTSHPRRRCRLLDVDMDVFLKLLKGTEICCLRVTEGALPLDSRCVRAYMKPEYNSTEVTLVIESEEFNEVGHGQCIPYHPWVAFKRFE